MISSEQPPADSLDHMVRRYIYERAASSGAIPQAAEIAAGVNRAADEVAASLHRLAEARVLMLAPNGGDIWAANPFCATPSGFRVEAKGNRYWGICIWDALGVVAALHASEATVRAPCADCGDMLQLEFHDGQLAPSESLVHFAIPARDWWKSVGFT